MFVYVITYSPIESRERYDSVDLLDAVFAVCNSLKGAKDLVVKCVRQDYEDEHGDDANADAVLSEWGTCDCPCEKWFADAKAINRVYRIVRLRMED